MTIAIGTLYTDGVIICADTKVVASDGATTSDMKVTVLAGEKAGIFAIADAAEDAHAAKMLATEIRDSAWKAKDPRHPEPEIKAVMTSWFHSYGLAQSPHLQFILARAVPPYSCLDNGTIYLCEPPATVLETHSIAIGRGSRAVDPLLRFLTGAVEYSFDLRMTLLRLAYLMYRAKKDEGSACGGDTHVIVVSNKGALAQIAPAEMAVAEVLASKIDDLLFEVSQMVTSGASAEIQQTYCTYQFVERYKAIAESARQLDFPSLNLLENTIRDCGCGNTTTPATA